MSTRILDCTFDFLRLQNTVGTENVTPSIKNYVALQHVTTLISWLSFWQLRLFKRAVTEQIVTQSRRQVKVQCFKMAKIDLASRSNPILWLKKAILQRENLKDVRKTSHWAVNICLCAFRNWKCLQNTDNLYRQPTMKIPELRWCLTEISFTYPSQFPGMF